MPSMWPVLVALVVCGSLDEGQARRFWEALSQRAEEVADFVPGRVESRTEVREGSGRARGTVDELWRLKGENQGQADYDVQREESGDPDISVKLRITARSTPFLAAAEGRVRLGKSRCEVVDGRRLVRFEFVETREEKPKGKVITLEGVAWLDASTGAPWKVTYRNPQPPKPVKKWELTLAFPSEGGAPPLPEDVRLDMEGQLFLWKRTVVVTQRLGQWQKLP